MVDELSKNHLVIPINLRKNGSGECKLALKLRFLISPITGFPPRDVKVYNFLVRKPFIQMDAFRRSQAFLIGIFKTIYGILEGIIKNVKNVSPEERQKQISCEFREYMKAGQTYEKHGPRRVQFYDKVISEAESVHILNMTYSYLS